jgi:hypothetical protein
MMPRDVTTRWNSTFDMLDFSLDYQIAINEITDECEMKLRQYELSEVEWTIVEQLCDVLWVCHHIFRLFRFSILNLQHFA